MFEKIIKESKMSDTLDVEPLLTTTAKIKIAAIKMLTNQITASNKVGNITLECTET